ncbi:MAG TPA: hypothetical protein VIP11_05855 [Gemmatimonadaceae bacterium]
MNLATQLADRSLRVKKRLRSERTQRQNDFRPNKLDLSNEIRAARFNLIWQRVPVSRRPMLQHVADVHLFARQIDRRENFCEQLTRSADERTSRFIFSRARSFADAHELRLRIAVARNGVRRGRVERTLRARRDVFRERIERSD